MPEASARALASAYDEDVAALRVGEGTDADSGQTEADTDTCQTVKSDGEVCGRELPCPYHSEEEN